MSNEDPRYGDRWSAQSRKARDNLRNRCTLCSERATQVHHGYYGLGLAGFSLPIPGFELEGWQIFPVCDSCHSQKCHKLANYRVSRNRWKNRNTSGFLWCLRINYWRKRCGEPIVWAVAVVAFGWLAGLSLPIILLSAVMACYYLPKLTQ